MGIKALVERKRVNTTNICSASFGTFGIPNIFPKNFNFS